VVLVDVQQGFDDPWWGRRNNPEADRNMRRLADAFRRAGHLIVHVRHDSTDPASPLHPSQPGNALKSYLSPGPDMLVTKSVNSSFHGTPDLHRWLTAQQVSTLVVAGITTNHCCETTARVGGNLGYNVWFALDATYTFDRQGPDGTMLSADQLAQATAVNLHGEFAQVATTYAVIDAFGAQPAAGSSPSATTSAAQTS
jgi:nicotinamidase-related amidase